MTEELKALKPYWLSWESKTDGFVLYFPWWVSGYIFIGDKEIPTICAAVWARSEEAAKNIIKNSHFEESDGLNLEYRFCEERPLEWSPFCDRFPRADWMIWWDDKLEVFRKKDSIKPLSEREFDIEDYRSYADSNRDKNRTSGPHWPLVIRYPILFDKYESLLKEKDAIETAAYIRGLQRAVEIAKDVEEKLIGEVTQTAAFAVRFAIELEAQEAQG